MRLFGEIKGGVPMFWLPMLGELMAGYERILGFVAGKDGKAYFPAFPPLGLDVVSDLTKVFNDLEWDPSAAELRRRCEVADEAMRAHTYPDIPMKYEAFPHQREALSQAYYRLRLAIEYDMGLGKTKIAVDAMRLWKKELGVTPVLLLCPAHVQDTWFNELEEHDVDRTLKVRKMRGPRGGVPTVEMRMRIYEQERQSPSDVLVLNYELVENDMEQLTSVYPRGFKAIVVDEAHYLASIQANRTKAVFDLVERIPRRLLLTGTATMGNPMNRWTLMRMLFPSMMPDAWAFKRRYADSVGTWRCLKCFAKRELDEGKKPVDCSAGKCEWKLERLTIKNYKNLHHLKEIIDRYCSIVKTKEECLDLPEREIIDVPIQVDGALREHYNQMVLNGIYVNFEVLGDRVYRERSPAIRNTRLLQILSGYIRLAENSEMEEAILDRDPEELEADPDAHPDMDVVVVKPRGGSLKDVVSEDPERAGVRTLIRIARSPKLDRLEVDLRQLVFADGLKGIIWAFERPELEDISALLTSMQIKHVCIDGDTDAKTKTRFREQFNCDQDTMIYLSQISINAGFTINAAKFTIYYSVSYKSVDYQQSRDRNYRIGQTDRVKIYRYFVPGAVSEYQLKALGKKETLDAGLQNNQLCMACPRVEGCLRDQIRPLDARCAVLPNKASKPRTLLKELK